MTAGVWLANAYATEERRISAGFLEPVYRALDTPAPAVQDMGVDHRRLDTAVAQQLLHRSDVVAGDQQVSREGVA